MCAARIVVAEDNSIYRAALCQYLNHFSALTVVATAQNGAEALRLVHEEAPELLILDLEMPEVDGWQVLRQLQESEVSVRILILSAHEDGYIQRRALESGAAAYVPKGNIQLLTETLYQLL